MSFYTFLLLLFVAGVAAYAVRKSRRREEAAPRRDTAVGEIFGEGFFECEVVGESHYQQAIEAICGGRSPEGFELRKNAMLVLEDENPADPRAVRVDIDGHTVGYLSRRIAKSYRDRLNGQNLPMGTYTCPALVVGGWDRGGGDRGYFGVKLDLPVDQ